MRGRAVTAFALAAIASGCSSSASEPPYTTATVNGLELPARVQGTRCWRWRRRMAGKGASGRVSTSGATIPGRQPGEVAPDREDYDRWLEGIGELGARVVRVYTILRPAFYDALASYNEANPDKPLFVIHGVWIPEEEWIESQDAYTPPKEA